MKTKKQPLLPLVNIDFEKEKTPQHWWHKETFNHLQPPANIKENEHKYIVEIAIPGFKKNDLRLKIHGNTLQLSGQRTIADLSKNEEFIIKEFAYHSFFRSFSIQQPIDASEITIDHVNGIFSIALPKAENELEDYSVDIL